MMETKDFLWRQSEQIRIDKFIMQNSYRFFVEVQIEEHLASKMNKTIGNFKRC